MAGNHKRTTIKIDGDKLKSLLENTTGKDIYTLSVENGFSRNLLNEACRHGYASAVVQNVAKLYGITPEAYQIKEIEEAKDPEQISIDDLTIHTITRDEVKAAIIDAMSETIPTLTQLITKAFAEEFKKATFEAFEENVPYMVAEFGKSSKGNIKAALRETLTAFGWNLKNNGGKN